MDADHPAGPLVRIEEAGLGPEAQVRVVVSGVSDPARLRGPWASSGALVELVGQRLRATTTVQALARAAGRALDSAEAEILDRRLREAVAAWVSPPPPLQTAEGALPTHVRPLVMGVVNVTPDSFSDGGEVYPDGHPDAAVDRAHHMIAAGADVLDIGGESTRPGADDVTEAEELTRVLPVVGKLSAETVVSVDTRKAEVAHQALEAGARVINDTSGAQEPALLTTVAEAGCAYVLMHTRGTPQDMQDHATYADVVAEVYEFLAAGLERCEQAGIARDAILIDPGLGFAKTGEHNLALLHGLRQFRGLGRPMLVGASRKSFLGALLDGAPPEDRLEGSLAAATAAVLAGAAMIRTHDVAQTRRAVRVASAVARAAMPEDT